MARLSEQIAGLLGSSAAPADSMSRFDGWVSERTARVRTAAAAGQPGLRLEVAQLRAELIAVRSQAPLPLQRSEAMWLEGLIELVSEALTDEPPFAVPRACA